MNDKEAIEMMRRCAREIRDLRSRLDHLAPLAESYGVIRDIVGALVHRSAGASEDLAWVLDKRIRELESKPTPKPDADDFIPF